MKRSPYGPPPQQNTQFKPPQKLLPSSMQFQGGKEKYFFQATFSDIDFFTKGCAGVPPAPHNSQMRCTPVLGCKVKCTAGFKAPNGKSSFELKCRNGRWEDRFSEFNGLIPNCEGKSSER